ncbi:MAG: right-handed parallel beta-helix repeat-containing protein [Limisphaerales bacterium]
MKTKFNQRGSWRTMETFAALIGLFISSTMCVVAPALPVVETMPVILRPGVTGAEIQSALDALPAGGGEVILPPGKIEVCQPIVLWRDHQTLRGAGKTTVLTLVDGANCPVIIMGEPVNHPKKTIRYLRVSDLYIDGNRAYQKRELWRLHGEGSEIRNNGIVVQGVSDSIVENLTAARCRSGGLVTTLGVRRLTVRGLDAFDNQFDGLACYDTTDSLFTDLFLHDNPCAGISLDLAFNHNTISHAILAGNDLGIFMRASRENKFQDISIFNSRHYGVFMAHVEQQTPEGLKPAPRTECVQNSFTNLVASNCGGAAFRVNNATCVNNIVIGAQFADNAKGGLSLAQPDLVTLQ